jgi:hypothetical protein
MGMFKALVAAAVLSFLAGCSTYYVKPGASTQDFNIDESACTNQATMMYPPVFTQVMVSAGYTTPMQTFCSGSGYYVTCSTVGGDFVPPVYATVDQNAGNRNGALDSCILARGWRKDHETFLGMTVKTY